MTSPAIDGSTSFAPSMLPITGESNSEELPINIQQVLVAEIIQSSEAAKSAARTAEESQKASSAAFADIQSKFSEISAISTLVLAAKTQIIDAQAVIATKSDHIQNAQEHADKIRSDLDRALTAATQHATVAEGQRSATQSSATTASELLSDIRITKGATEIDASAVVAARKQAEQSSIVAKNLAEKAGEIETRIAAYENKLSELGRLCDIQLKNIVDLLPGATTVGLAHAFDQRRQGFLKPASRWQWLFVGSVLAIVALTITALWHVFQGGPAPTYDELFRMWLARLPVMVALVWLALHASRESALAKRLEEDYGYKAAVASCFEGFKKQMSEVGAEVASDSALAKLLANTLETIALPPGRIYDRHELAVSPADEMKQAAKAAADVANAIKP
jgi:hypothetical protein